MRIAQVIGNITLSQCHPALQGFSLRIVHPFTHDDLASRQAAGPETLVTVDTYSAGVGDLILLAEGPEAAQPFRPELRPIDAYNAGIIDDLELQTKQPKRSNSRKRSQA